MKDFRVYTIQQVAEILQLRESTIRDYIAKGKLKVARFGTRVRISQKHLEEFFDAHVESNAVNLEDNEEQEENET